MKPHLLGRRQTLGGNACDFCIVPGKGPVADLSVECQRWPLSELDKIDYLTRSLRAIERCAQEYFVGSALVVLG
jgi:hypothetical protein